MRGEASLSLGGGDRGVELQLVFCWLMQAASKVLALVSNGQIEDTDLQRAVRLGATEMIGNLNEVASQQGQSTTHTAPLLSA